MIEAVYLALLSGSVRQGTLMGAVLAYRALYYLVPLLGGIALYLLLERVASDEDGRHGSKRPAKAGRAATRPAGPRRSR